MNAFSNLTVALLMISNVAAADPAAPAPAPERRVVLASNAARAMIVEAKADGQFWFEHCYLPHSATETIKQELSSSDYKDCTEVSRPLPDNEATRGEFSRQFGIVIGKEFERHSQYAVISRTAVAGVVGTFIGVIAPMLPIKYINTTSARRIAASAIITGATSAAIMGTYAKDHMEELGLGRETELSLDADLDHDLILLDEVTKSPRHANQAIGVFEFALDDATTATLRPN